MNFAVFNQLSKVIAGGETGVDRAALDWAIGRKIAHGGWCPRGRMAEDGRLDARYLLRETATDKVLEAAAHNALEGDATLIINTGELEDTALAARQMADQAHKPCLVLQLEGTDLAPLVDMLSQWMEQGKFDVLTIAGPQESERPRIYRLTRLFLSSV
jgi:Circularly permutated YpsA SLOG family